MNSMIMDTFSIEGYDIRVLSIDDEQKVQQLCVECSDYHQLAEGKEVTSKAGKELLTDMPEGKKLDDKIVLGVFDHQRKLIGVIDMIRDYPKEKVWFIGLMMLSPESRSLGLGFKLAKTYQQWAYDNGALTIKLGVLKENERAFVFWERVGFKVISRIDNYNIGNKTTSVFVMEKELIF